MTGESQARIADILAGPWTAFGDHAREILPTLSEAERAYWLRPHWGDKIDDARHLEFRESIDQWLELLQIFELAIETGYLTTEDLRDTVLAQLEPLMASEAVWGYVRAYQFVPVWFLAARYGLSRSPVKPPAVNPRAQFRFASFLCTHTEFTSDPNVELFTELMDDFWFDGVVNSHYVRNWLTGADVPVTPRLEHLRAGYVGFVTLLGGLFPLLDEGERPLFGLAYAYWLARFHGYRLGAAGFQPSGKGWQGLESSKLVSDADSGPLLQRGAESIRAVWEATRHLIVGLPPA